MNNGHNRQRLLEAIDDYLINTPVAPGFTVTHLNNTKKIVRFIVTAQNDRRNLFNEPFNRCIQELDKWESSRSEQGDLAYTLLAIRIQKELRRFKDIYLLQDL
jgi:hypothetical protein